MQDYVLGVNYWASHAGVNMWREWKPDVVERDMAVLKENGVRILRVFPNWRDFQPVKPAFGGGHQFKEYRMKGDEYPSNPYYLDETMMEHFGDFCRIAGRLGMKLIVGLITGWMSGRLFVPPALYDKNIFTDPAALFFQQLFLKGFVSRMKNQESIYAWDLGNECNCMDEAHNREEAYSWTSVIVNAIKAVDSARPVISGMHSLETEGVWNIQDQGEITDILTTHPYPLWVEHCQIAPLDDFRTLLHATAQTQYYATVGKKPCLVEEIGSMGPMVCNEEIEAGFLKVNLWSNWANGAVGLLWWCANEQSLLTAPPYDWNMCERELGMLDVQMQPKPSLLQMKEFSKQLEEMSIKLPYRQTDAVCILSQGQSHWGIAYMSYILAKQAGLTMDFRYCGQELPDSRLYFLPSVCMSNMSKKSYDHLKNKVFKEGATLYISVKDGFFTEFEELTGFRVVRSRRAWKSGTVNWEKADLPYDKPYQIELSAKSAEVLLTDEEGKPLFGMAQYGAGKVYFLNFPMEDMLITKENGFMLAYHKFYDMAAREILSDKGIRRDNSYIGITLHKGEEADYAVLVNYTAREQDPAVRINEKYYSQVRMLHGDRNAIEPFGALVMELKKQGAAAD